MESPRNDVATRQLKKKKFNYRHGLGAGTNPAGKQLQRERARQGPPPPPGPGFQAWPAHPPGSQQRRGAPGGTWKSRGNSRNRRALWGGGGKKAFSFFWLFKLAGGVRPRDPAQPLLARPRAGGRKAASWGWVGGGWVAARVLGLEEGGWDWGGVSAPAWTTPSECPLPSPPPRPLLLGPLCTLPS